jgi:hypothetical protein
MHEFVVFRRDPVTYGMCYGLDEEGRPRRVNQATLQAEMAAWPGTPTTPDDVRALLGKSRIAALCSLVGQELLTDAVLSSLHAVEAALRQRIEESGASSANARGEPLAWSDLFQRAISLGLIAREPDDANRDLIDYGRHLRNSLSHPTSVMYMPYAAALPLIETSHRLVARLFPDSSQAG